MDKDDDPDLDGSFLLVAYVEAEAETLIVAGGKVFVRQTGLSR